MLHCVVNIFAVFTARHICIAQTMPWQNVCLSFDAEYLING